MVSEQYKCIFIEVPKTGSTSIRHLLGQPLKPHLNICQIKQSLPIERFETFFKFGFVRNPWDRAVSLYERNEGLQLKNQMSFDEFVGWLKFSSSTCQHPLPHRYQLDWFVDQNGDVIVDFIGRLERLKMDWDLICTRLGLPQELPHLNKNNDRMHYSRYYNEKTRRIIQERFSVDIDYFGYEFECE
jgi:hypothetical protein